MKRDTQEYIKNRNTTTSMWEMNVVTGKLTPPQARHLQLIRVNGAWIFIHIFTINRI